MGNGDAVEGLPSALTFKVHGLMCSELLKLVTGVSRIFSEIEAARPRCSSGIDALCLLNKGLVDSKSLLHHWSESSVLYLALTGEAVLSRCKKSRKLLEDSLVQIQNNVPVMLSAKISGITAVIKSGAFRLDPSEEEAGRLLRELLDRYCCSSTSEKSALASIHTVSSLLRISSHISLLVEKRSIRKLLEKLGDTKPPKKDILLLILKLVNKYAKAISKEPKEYKNATYTRVDVFLSGPEPPEEFVCPLSSRLMCDPVIIASGETYERMWIQKWLDEGHNFCPKTNENLAHTSFTSNAAMKALISKWCASQNMEVPVALPQEVPWESPVGSVSSSMNDLRLPLDFSGVSLESTNEAKGIVDRMLLLFSEFSVLPWDSQRHAVEEMMMLLRRGDDDVIEMVPSHKFVGLILGFLKDARDLRDADAQMTGCILLSEFVQKHRSRSSSSSISSLIIPKLIPILEDNTNTNTALLSRHCLVILKNLSQDQDVRMSIAETNCCLSSIARVVEKDDQEDQELALAVLLPFYAECCKLPTVDRLITRLASISTNGSVKGKAMALELLRILRDDAGNKSGVEKISRRKAGLFAKILPKRR